MMELTWDSNKIDLQNLIKLGREDKSRMQKYLTQFLDLIPQRIISLQKGMEGKDRTMVRKTIHQMKPQLQFFGIPEIETSIQRIETEYETIPFDELSALIKDVIIKLKSATSETDVVLKNNFH